MEGIERRFERIMDKYLIPAGYEIQKAQQEYERVLQGKELFDKDIANLLDNAQNNNERYEILSGLKDYAIPNYDDLPAAYEGLKGPLLRAVKGRTCHRARSDRNDLREYGWLQGRCGDEAYRGDRRESALCRCSRNAATAYRHLSGRAKR